MKTQSATLRRAMEALRSICEATPGRAGESPERAAAISIQPVPVRSDSRTGRETLDCFLLHDPAAWREDFARWMVERCAHREGRDDWGGIGWLLVDFAEWCAARNAVPCTRATFERLLQDAGFHCAEGGVLGLVLREDLGAVLRSQDALEGNQHGCCGF